MSFKKFLSIVLSSMSEPVSATGHMWLFIVKGELKEVLPLLQKLHWTVLDALHEPRARELFWKYLSLHSSQ